jgi:hypothetical protein
MRVGKARGRDLPHFGRDDRRQIRLVIAEEAAIAAAEIVQSLVVGRLRASHAELVDRATAAIGARLATGALAIAVEADRAMVAAVVGPAVDRPAIVAD